MKNEWIKRSYNITNAGHYLDKLSEIYQVNLNPERSVSDASIKMIKEVFDKESNSDLVRKLLTLERFPIDDPYVSIMRASPSLIDENPETVERIGKNLRNLGYEKLVALTKQPMSASRQMGNAFKGWLKRSGYPFLNYDEFHNYSDENVVFLSGSDKVLKKYVTSELKVKLGDTKKGLDIVFRKGIKYCFGEAKFITASGGTQTNQLDIALDVADLNKKDGVFSVAILDGVVWFNSSYLEKIRSRSDKNIITGLLLKEFLECF